MDPEAAASPILPMAAHLASTQRQPPIVAYEPLRESRMIFMI